MMMVKHTERPIDVTYSVSISMKATVHTYTGVCAPPVFWGCRWSISKKSG